MKIIRKEALSNSSWSGGSTTQLFIYPPSASYAERNFDLRISTASIEASPSTFTSLPGVQRRLMLIKGALNIDFGQHGSVQLQAFEQVAFSGDWETCSEGLGTDFNVMTRINTQAQLQAMILEPGEDIQNPSTAMSILYLYEGSLLLSDGSILHSGDVCIAEQIPIEATANSKAILILTNCSFN